MTIASALIAAQGRVADAYTAISNKGGTLPATQNLANMPTAINSISGLIGETRTEQLDSTSGNTYTPSAGYNGITSITVTPKNYNRTVTAQTVPSTWAVPSGYSGHGNISVNAVTSSIDANIQAGNIKSGVTILGVTGTYGGGGETIDEWAERVLTGDYINNSTSYNTLGQTATVATEWADSAITTINLPNVELLMSSSFGSGTRALESISIPKLKISQSTVINDYSSGNFTQITQLDFPELLITMNVVCTQVTGLVKIYVDKLLYTYNGIVQSCPNLEYIYAPSYIRTGANHGNICTTGVPKITTIYLRDIPKIDSPILSWQSCPDFDTLVLAGNHIVELTNVLNIKQSFYAKFYNDTGSIYVPDALVSSYQAATNWSTIASMIKPLSTWTNPYA